MKQIKNASLHMLCKGCGIELEEKEQDLCIDCEKGTWYLLDEDHRDIHPDHYPDEECFNDDDEAAYDYFNPDEDDSWMYYDYYPEYLTDEDRVV